jgi:hypothetical protein
MKLIEVVDKKSIELMETAKALRIEALHLILEDD